MAVTVKDLLGVPDPPLRLLAGDGQARRPIRWVHASELEDPTPWLKGGELILTTGMGVGATPAAQRSYVKRLAAADVSGLGFGLGFSHEKVPRPLIAAAEAAGLPLFEVPYPVPFIALTEAIFTRILAEQYDTLQRAVDAEHVLTRAVMDGKGIDGISDSLAGVTKGWVLLLDLHGLPLASTGRAAALRAERVWDELRDSRPEGTSFSVTLVDKGHHIWVLPVGAQGRVEAFLAVGKPEQYDTLQRAVDAEHVLTRAVMDGKGVDGIADSLAGVTKGWVLLLDLHGLPLASTGRAAALRAERVWDELRDSRPEGTSFSVTLVDKGHHIWVLPVGAQGRVEAFLAVGKPEQLSQLDRIVAGHALSLFAMELAKSRAVADAERRLQGDFFDQLAKGELSATQLTRGLSRFGFERGADVIVLSLEGKDPAALADAAADDRSRAGGGFLISAHAGGVNLLIPAASGLDVAELAASIAGRLGEDVRTGAGSPVAPAEVGRSLREATYALQVCRLEGWQHAGFEDLGTYRLLLSMTDPDALRAFADAMLAPLDGYDASQGGDLIASLQAFLQHNARWETAATQLFVHRHTLRYRMRKVEELTGRDLGSSFDRMEFWLALRARDLMTATDRDA